jgi:hypothetical protein
LAGRRRCTIVPADLFVAHYLGAHAMNFLDASLADGAVRLACCGADFRIDLTGHNPSILPA